MRSAQGIPWQSHTTFFRIGCPPLSRISGRLEDFLGLVGGEDSGRIAGCFREATAVVTPRVLSTRSVAFLDAGEDNGETSREAGRR